MISDIYANTAELNKSFIEVNILKILKISYSSYPLTSCSVKACFIHNYNKPMINSLIDFSSGILSGVVNTLSGFFLDTVKVRMQVDPKFTSTVQVLTHIIKH